MSGSASVFSAMAIVSKGVQASASARNLGPKIPMSQLNAEAREKSGFQCILESKQRYININLHLN